jgi:hypothetical protein
VSTINAILEPDSDGSLHLPLPPELRAGKVKVHAVLEAAEVSSPSRRPIFGCLAGKITLEPDFDAPLDDLKEYME